MHIFVYKAWVPLTSGTSAMPLYTYIPLNQFIVENTSAYNNIVTPKSQYANTSQHHIIPTITSRYELTSFCCFCCFADGVAVSAGGIWWCRVVVPWGWYLSGATIGQARPPSSLSAAAMTTTTITGL